MAGSKQMCDVLEGLEGKQGKAFGIDLENTLASEFRPRHVITGNLAVGRFVGSQRKHFLERERGHIWHPFRLESWVPI